MNKMNTKNMKKLIVLFVASLSLTLVSAQTLDFSGNWKLNTALSKLNAEFSFAPAEIIIVQKGNDMNVEKHSNWQGEDFTITDKFTLDGKECINTGFQDTQKKSTTAWSEDKKSLIITSKLVMGDGNEMTITETYSTEGKNLVLISKASSSYGDVEETMVYEKQ